LPDDYAQTYDQTFSPFKDYSREALFLRDVMRRWRPQARSVLDIACGTGTHLLELARMGFDAVGLDLAPDILEVARRKAASQGLRAQFVPGDMRNFRLNRKFDAAVNMFYSFQNVLDTEEEQIDCLQAIHDTLAPAGILIMELLPEENNLQQYPPGQVFPLYQEVQEDGTVLQVSSENRIISPEKKEIIFTYETQKEGKILSVKRMVSPLRRLYARDLAALFARGGFSIIARYGHCDLHAGFEAHSPKLVVAAEPASHG
jgi:SAM-dependent methyltransferase